MPFQSNETLRVCQNVNFNWSTLTCVHTLQFIPIRIFHFFGFFTAIEEHFLVYIWFVQSTLHEETKFTYYDVLTDIFEASAMQIDRQTENYRSSKLI